MQANFIRPAMNYGLIIGALFSFNFLLSVSSNPYAGLISNIIIILIPVFFYKVTVRLRANECEGVITFHQAFHFIVRIVIYGTLISALTKYIYVRFINPEYSDILFERSLQMLTELVKTPVGQEEQEAMREMYRPMNFTCVISIGVYLAGVVMALILAAIIKKEED